MAEPARAQPDMTEDEYLAFEQSSPSRHEFVAGRAFAWAGGTSRHARLAFRLGLRLERAGGGSGCLVYLNDFRLRVDARHSYYPDVMVVCGDVDPDATSTSSRCVVVEVSTPGTASIDRREKLDAYTRLESLKAYLILESRARRGELHRRLPSGRWLRTELGAGNSVDLSCPEGFRMTLADLYDDSVVGGSTGTGLGGAGPAGTRSVRA